MTKAIASGIALGVLALASAVLAAPPTALGIDPACDGADNSSAESPAGSEGEPSLIAGVGAVVFITDGCTATATCPNGTVQCSSSTPGTCSSQNSICSGRFHVTGYVECDGIRKVCRECPNE
jgi:hypothetical protein